MFSPVRSKDGSNLNQNEVAHGALAVIKAVQVESFTTSSNALEFGDMAEFTCKVSGGRAPYKVEMKIKYQKLLFLFHLAIWHSP